MTPTPAPERPKPTKSRSLNREELHRVLEADSDREKLYRA